ncbi:hypothetical protein ACFLQK_02100, partial [bacterium]
GNATGTNLYLSGNLTLGGGYINDTGVAVTINDHLLVAGRLFTNPSDGTDGYLGSDKGLTVKLDDDDDGSEMFIVRNSADENVFYSDESGNLFASGALVLGDSATGTNFYLSGNSTAAYFYGDGSNLTNVTGTDDTKVARAGDGMSGALVVSQGAATSTISLYNTAGGDDLIYGNQTGGGALIDLEVGGNRTFYVDNNGSIYASGALSLEYYASAQKMIASGGVDDVLIDTYFGGDRKFMVDTSGNIFASGAMELYSYASATTYYGDGSNLTGVDATDRVARSGDTMSGALGISQSAGTASLSIRQTGAASPAAYFGITNFANNDDLIFANTMGFGRHIVLQRNGMTSFIVDSTGTISATGSLHLDGNGTYLLDLENGGNNTFYVDWLGNTYSSGSIEMDSYASATAMFAGGGSGGVLFDGYAGGDRKVMIDTSGNIFASGAMELYSYASATTYYGDGSNLTGVDANDKVSKTGDQMSGSLIISQSAGTSTVAIYQTDTASSALHVEITDGNNDGPVIYAHRAGGAYNGKLMHLQRNGMEGLYVDMYGAIYASGTLTLQGSGAFGSTSLIGAYPAVFGGIVFSVEDDGAIFASGSLEIDSYASATAMIAGGGSGGVLFDGYAGGDRKVMVDTSGNIFASGALELYSYASATTYYGDGSNLTGVGAGAATSSAEIVIDGAGQPVSETPKMYFVKWPFGGTIEKISVLSDVTGGGTVTIDVWMDSWAEFLADTLDGGDSIFDVPGLFSIGGARGAETSTFDAGENTFSAGDVLMVDIDTNTRSAEVITIIIEVTKN